MLQAESEKLRQAWIQAVQASIASAYRESPDSYYAEVGTYMNMNIKYACCDMWIVQSYNNFQYISVIIINL